MKAQEVELALEEVEKAGEEQAKFGNALEKVYQSVKWGFHLTYSIKCVYSQFILKDISRTPVSWMRCKSYFLLCYPITIMMESLKMILLLY